MTNIPDIQESSLNENFKNILLIEDSSFYSKVIQGLLRDEKVNLFKTKNVTDALKILETVNIDLILLDIIMPETDGYTFLESLKNNESTRHIPVIIVSSLNQEIDKNKGFSLGAVNYITKPFNSQDFRDQINKILQKS